MEKGTFITGKNRDIPRSIYVVEDFIENSGKIYCWVIYIPYTKSCHYRNDRINTGLYVVDIKDFRELRANDYPPEVHTAITRMVA
jgi:hypothetical protein